MLNKNKNNSKSDPVFQKASSFVHVDRATSARLSAVWLACCATLVLFLSVSTFISSREYTPIRQQALLDAEHKRIERQDLLKPALHNAKFRKDEIGAASDFGKFAMLTLFSYNKEDLEQGRVRDAFNRILSEDQASVVYENQFLHLSQQKIVMAQDAVVRARVVGELEYEGWKEVPYYGMSGRTSVPSMTYKFTGKMLLTVHGNQDYPTLFNFMILVQRAKVQDRMMGYQVILLEVN